MSRASASDQAAEFRKVSVAPGPESTFDPGYPKASGQVVLQPDPAGVLGALQRIGYALEDSAADLIDNSIDAQADAILLRFMRTRDQLKSLAIIDDGVGMSPRRLDDAMTFGRRTDKTLEQLGKYGMGLKSASFAQCDSLTVLTRQRRVVSGQRWTAAGIASGWKCERLDQSEAAHVLDRDWRTVDVRNHGTLVMWSSLDAFAVAAGRADDVLGTLISRLEQHLGLHFHRFLSSDRIEIAIDSLDIETGQVGPLHRIQPLDPFDYPRSGHRSYPRTYPAVVENVGALELVAHIWPPKSNLPGYRLGGGRVSRRQGFYFYRNDRLIQAGGWNGWRDDAEPHASLARVVVELPAEFDEAFALNLQKTGLVVPVAFFDALDAAQTIDGRHRFRDYVTDAIETYRARDPVANTDVPFVPVRGVAPAVRKTIRRAVANGAPGVQEMRFEWAALPPETFFEIRRDDATIVLNNRWRKELLAGRRASKNDLPVIKSLMYLLLRDELGRERMREESRRWIEICQDILTAAARDE